MSLPSSHRESEGPPQVEHATSGLQPFALEDSGQRPPIPFTWLGKLSYDQAHALQLQLRDRVVQGDSGGCVLLLEHEPVVTLGRRGTLVDLAVSETELAEQGIALRRSERGGLATFHGPGQLVAYPVARLRSLALDVPTYVWRLEQTVIRTVADYGIAARRQPEARGVWVGEAKLASIGIAITRGVCWHGVALNVEPDLRPFGLIQACGLDAEATSIVRCSDAQPEMRDVAAAFSRAFVEVFWGQGSPREIS